MAGAPVPGTRGTLPVREWPTAGPARGNGDRPRRHAGPAAPAAPVKRPLRARFSIYALAAAGYLAGLFVIAAFVGLPALRRVDRSLAPLQSVFRGIADRQRQIIQEIELLDRLIKAPGPPAPHASVEPGGKAATPSLLSLYGSLL